MSTLVFGEGLERVAVRPITPDIFWITHCLGDKAQDIYKNYFGMLPNAADYSGHRIVDYPFSAFLIRDEKSLIIDTGAPRQQANTLKAVEYVLGDKPLDYIWISHVELPHAGNAPALKRRYPQAVFMGALLGDELASVYRAADVFVFPSHTDTFGLVMIEALACGLPVAAFPVPGPLDIVGSSGRGMNGTLTRAVGALDDDLGAAIRRALNVDRAAAAAYGASFCWEKCTDQFEEGLVEALKGISDQGRSRTIAYA